MTVVASRRAVELLASDGTAMANVRILVLGVARTSGTSDVSGSPALDIIDCLRRAGASVSFTDDLVENVRVQGGRMHSVRPTNPAEWDLVLVHTVHPGTDLSWLTDARRVHRVAERAIL